jgi:signal transduction histidine kinase
LFQLAGLVIIGLVSSLVYLSVNRQSRLAAAVQQRTRELSTANSQLVQSHQLLELRVQERTRALSTLLDVSFNLASTLELQPLLETILDQLENVVGYRGAALLLLEDDEWVTAVRRGPLPPILEERSSNGSPVQPASRLRNYWEETDWSKPIRSSFNNPLTGSDQEAMPQLANEGEETGPSWMGVPLKSHNLLIGAIILYHDDPEYYTARHGQLVMVVANQAAVTIDKARLYQQAQHLAVLQERQRLARELHDSVSQALYGIALGARTAQTLLSRDPEKVVEPLNYVLSFSEAALTEMRALIFELRPESLAKEGLIAALERQAQVLQSRHRLAVETKLGEEPAISLPLKEALYRVAQEATHNIVKHAAAEKASIRLQRQDDRLILEIRDNGRGFNPEDPFPGHFGLHSMRERVEQAGGTLIIESSPGQGTCIQVSLRESAILPAK